MPLKKMNPVCTTFLSSSFGAPSNHIIILALSVSLHWLIKTRELEQIEIASLDIEGSLLLFWQ